MKKITTEETLELVKKLKEIANSINDYQIKNFNILSTKEFMTLNKAEFDILSRVQDLLAKSVVVEVENSAELLSEMTTITQNIKDVLGTIDKINRVISITTSTVFLVSALISKNPTAIAGAISSLKEELNKNKK